MFKVVTEIVRRVYESSEGNFLEIGPDKDAGCVVEIRTVDNGSESWFGATRLCLDKEMAIAVAHAILAAAEELPQK